MKLTSGICALCKKPIGTSAPYHPMTDEKGIMYAVHSKCFNKWEKGEKIK